MKTFSKITIVACVLASAASLSARAQLITWETGTSTYGVNTFDITGASDIATNGGYVDALQTHGFQGSYAAGAGSTTPTNVLNPTTGITTKFNVFTSSGSSGTSPGNYFADGTFSITADGDTGSDGSGSDATPYQQVLDGSTYAFTPEIGTVTMSGLQMGHEYQIQVWASAGYRPTTYTGLNVAEANFVINGPGNYAIGTFTATGATETFTYQNSYHIDVPAGEINALSLRDLSVPEPSTYAMLFGGLGLLMLISRYRRLA